MTPSFKQIGIVTAPSGKPEVATCKSRLVEWLTKRDAQILDSDQAGLDLVIQNSDLIISLGGDGTILRIAGKMINRVVPVLGVNLGSLGFLTEVKVDEVLDELKSIFSGNLQLEERLMLSCVAKNEKGTTVRRFQALNDVVVNREGLTRYMRVDLKLNNELMTRFFGDGVIIATPTGSTAYSLSAGGPIVYPGLSDLVVTPICPHASALRTMIVAQEHKLEIRITCDEAKERALLTADGQENLEIDNGYSIEVTSAPNRFPLIKSSKRSYFGTLREKFKIPI